MTVPTFVPGLELAEGFYVELVAPTIARTFPELRYSAALLGPGSEVLGFDDVRSTDHHWGPRVMLFLRIPELGPIGESIRTTLAQRLPARYRGFSTHFTAPDPFDHGVQHLADHQGGAINHRVELNTIELVTRMSALLP